MTRSLRWRPVAATLLTLALAFTAAPAYATDRSSVTADESVVHARTAHTRGAAITLTGPAEVTAGETVVLTGRVTTLSGKVRRARLVQVAEQRGGRWVVVGKARSSKRGTFRISIPAGSAAGERVLRAQAPRAKRLRAVRTGWLSLVVLAPPVGSSDDWSFLMDGGSRWNPCGPITWSYNPAGQAYGALADVTTAIGNIAAVSGLDLEYAGPSPLVYLGDEAALAGGADIVVGWADAAQLDSLTASVVGVGGAVGSKVSGQDVEWELTQGWVTLDKDDPLDPAPGFGASSYGQVMMHEMLHALGLGHAHSPRELMAEVAGPQNTTFGPGDLAGIARIGAAAGCL